MTIGYEAEQLISHYILYFFSNLCPEGLLNKGFIAAGLSVFSVSASLLSRPLPLPFTVGKSLIGKVKGLSAMKAHSTDRRLRRDLSDRRNREPASQTSFQLAVH